MNTSRTQKRKIRPIESPNLVLKSPIAYHGVSDLSVVPIIKDGIAVCEKCGAVGVKHSFYTKERKFCSLACARSYTGLVYQKENEPNEDGDIENKAQNHNKKQANFKYKLMDSTEHLVGMIPLEPLPQLPSIWQPAIEDFLQPMPMKFSNGNLTSTYEWQNELFACDFTAAPVRLFPHAPLSDMWNNVVEGMKVEVKNTDCDNLSYNLSDYFWVATVLKLKGYMGLLRYEGFGNDESKDFWLNLMHSEVHPVGWCATRGKPLIPPRTIENKYSDWKAFLVQQLSGARTLPTDFYNKVSESLRSRFRIGHILEVVDKNRISQVKVATVREIVGKRLHIRYYDNTPEDNGFWCHEDCSLIHPVGWAREVGHLIDAPVEYLDRLEQNSFDPDNTSPDLFKYFTKKDPHNTNVEYAFTEGMKLEAIDPLNLSSICVATVMKVLKHGYMMIRIDCYPPDESGSDWFCYHENSPCIFPVGYCEQHGIPLTVTLGQPPSSVNSDAVSETNANEFLPGMRLECADLMDPRLVCVATIARVVGRLLKVHFNGWGDEYDQWLDCESTDIYPVGWCQAVGHKLEAPFVPARQPTQPTRKKGRKKKLSKPLDQKLIKHDSVELKSVDPLKTEEIDLKMDDVDLDNGMFDMDVEHANFASDDGSSADGIKMETDVESDVKEKRIPKAIPRMIGTIDMKMLETTEPESWDSEDVAEFLSINDCAPYSMNFSHIDGKAMLDLTKDQIIELLQMKVGPSLKIYDLIQQLKCKLKPVQARNKIMK